MEKNLSLMVIDECNDTYCFKAFCVSDAEALTRDEIEAYDAKLAYYTKLCGGDEKLGYRTMYDVEYCKRMGF